MSTIIDKIAWIYLSERKLLCVRSKGKELYYIPGGKRDPGEEDQQTLIREVQEELGVTLQQETIMHVGTFEAEADSKATGTIVRLTCYTADYEGTLQPDSEIEEMAWLSYDDQEQVSVASQLVFEQLKQQELLD
ncbi:NUDIX hydrolase [Paenibacillus hunanensis]|uniref:8-oxo-dGTP pyrophosphatase MutT (NUDIX family) n=1 Tax=Paenibacillus hunanensis TaxID=539262 RepID=A0ABU1ISN2_9BACL|nr:NUDIX domain-containing protein [Paenibacillus hunanensis]MDR6242226.1 8-oxo-dGTP pyrophosphatase MutT (NUDIX family) [Paenibacillus hunanensis]GGJ06221.1 DNA mismatch repair protein MutT [Paenibacillus hunanensis]